MFASLIFVYIKCLTYLETIFGLLALETFGVEGSVPHEHLRLQQSMLGGWVFSSHRVTSLLLWPIRPTCLALYIVMCSSCLVNTGLGSDLMTLPWEPAREGWQTLPVLLWFPQACEGRQMVELNSEPPLHIMKKNGQPPGRWKSEPVHL